MTASPRKASPIRHPTIGFQRPRAIPDSGFAYAPDEISHRIFRRRWTVIIRRPDRSEDMMFPRTMDRK